MSRANLLLAVAALSGALAVGLGAMGAHALKPRLDAAALSAFETAVTYHFLHTLALVVAALWLRLDATASGAVNVAAWAFVAGIVLFSGSLYVLALGGPRLLGPVTPIGGVAFIVGWLCLGVAAIRG